MPRRLKTLLATLTLPLWAVTPVADAKPCANTELEASPQTAAKQAQATLCLVNRQRRMRGLPALRPSRELREAARRHALDMVRRQYFAHITPGGLTDADRISRTGYLHGATSWIVGETIAWGSGASSSPRAIVRQWMRSSAHRAAILDRRFRQLGIGVAIGTPIGEDGATVTATFGARSV